MMKDWSEAFKDRMESGGVQVPEGELEFLQGRIAAGRRNRALWWTALSMAAAACLAAVLLVRPRGEGLEDAVRIVDDPVAMNIEKDDSPVQELLEPLEAQEPVEASVPKAPGRLTAAVLGPSVSANSYEPEVSDAASENEPVHEVKPEVKTEEKQEEKAAPVYSVPDRVPDLKATDFEDWGAGGDRNKNGGGRLSLKLSSGEVLSGTTRNGIVSQPNDVYAWKDMADSEVELSYLGENIREKYTGKYTHSQPRTFGVSISYGLSDKFFLTSGLDYSYCHSRLTYPINDKTLDQRAHYLGIPLHLDWSVIQGNNLSLYIGAGGEARKCIGARLEQRRLKDDNIYYSLLGLAGLKYEPFKGVGIFLEPQYSHTFLPAGRTGESYVPTAISENPDLFTLKAGLSFSFR